MTTLDTGIEKRLEELESRLAFQDDLIETLNETVARQDRDLARLELKVKSLSEKINDLSEAGAALISTPGDEVPPHY